MSNCVNEEVEDRLFSAENFPIFPECLLLPGIRGEEVMRIAKELGNGF